MFLAIAYGIGPVVRSAREGLWSFLEVILHIGAHRTGTSSLQLALRQNRQNLMKNGVVFWGPRETRAGMFSGLLRHRRGLDLAREKRVARNRGLISIELQRLQARGVRTLVISEENIIGTMVENLRTGLLYPGLDRRLGPFFDVFRGHLVRVGMAIRPYGDYWASVLSYGLRSGRVLADSEVLERLARLPRPWRRVVADVALAFPGIDITVWDFDRLIGRPQVQYRLLTAARRGWIAPMTQKANASPGREGLRDLLLERGLASAAAMIPTGDGPYQPFHAAHLAAFDTQYQADLNWLRSQNMARVSFADGDERKPAAMRLIKRGLG